MCVCVLLISHRPFFLLITCVPGGPIRPPPVPFGPKPSMMSVRDRSASFNVRTQNNAEARAETGIFSGCVLREESALFLRLFSFFSYSSFSSTFLLRLSLLCVQVVSRSADTLPAANSEPAPSPAQPSGATSDAGERRSIRSKTLKF